MVQVFKCTFGPSFSLIFIICLLLFLFPLFSLAIFWLTCDHSFFSTLLEVFSIYYENVRTCFWPKQRSLVLLASILLLRVSRQSWKPIGGQFFLDELTAEKLVPINKYGRVEALVK